MAKAALRREQRAPSERRFIDGALTARLFIDAVGQDTVLFTLCLLSHIIFFRVPSETVPARACSFSEDGEGVLPSGRHSRAGLRGGGLVHELAMR